MSQNALGQLKHLKTARARWPFPDVVVNDFIELIGIFEGQTKSVTYLESRPSQPQL